MSATTTRAVQAPPTFPKPTYPDAFDWVGELPPEIKANMCSLLLRIWRHTNSDKNHENYGKAWMSHPAMAGEMHVSPRLVSDLFDEGWDLGIISREHLFKKKGKTVISTEPYVKATSHGLGEYLGSRYWVNWSTVKQLHVNGVADSATPNTNDVSNLGTSVSPNGVADSATPIGVADSATPISIGVAVSSTPVAVSSTPVAESATKVLIKGLTEGLKDLEGKEGGVEGTPAAPPAHPSFCTDDGQDKTGSDAEVTKQIAFDDLVREISLAFGSRNKGKRLHLSRAQKDQLRQFVGTFKSLGPEEWQRPEAQVLKLFELWSQHHPTFKGINNVIAVFISQHDQELEDLDRWIEKGGWDDVWDVETVVQSVKDLSKGKACFSKKAKDELDAALQEFGSLLNTGEFDAALDATIKARLALCSDDFSYENFGSGFAADFVESVRSNLHRIAKAEKDRRWILWKADFEAIAQDLSIDIDEWIEEHPSLEANSERFSITLHYVKGQREEFAKQKAQESQKQLYDQWRVDFTAAQNDSKIHDLIEWYESHPAPSLFAADARDEVRRLQESRTEEIEREWVRPVIDALTRLGFVSNDASTPSKVRSYHKNGVTVEIHEDCILRVVENGKGNPYQYLCLEDAIQKVYEADFSADSTRLEQVQQPAD